MVWLGVDLRTDTKQASEFKRDWTTCSKFGNHARLDTQHDLGDVYYLSASKVVIIQMDMVKDYCC